MDDIFARICNDLIGRAEGPMNFRCIMQPLIAISLAVRAGLRDEREGRPPFLWMLIWMPGERTDLVKRAWRDISRIFIIAIVLDIGYQHFILKEIYFGELILTALLLAVLPYFLVRGPVCRIARMKRKAKDSETAKGSETGATE